MSLEPKPKIDKMGHEVSVAKQKLDAFKLQIEMETEIVKSALMKPINSTTVLQQKLPRIIKLIEGIQPLIQDIINDQKTQLKELDGMLKEKEDENQEPIRALKARFGNIRLNNVRDLEKLKNEHRTEITGDLVAAFETVRGNYEYKEMQEEVFKQPIKDFIKEQEEYNENLKKMQEKFENTLKRIA